MITIPFPPAPPVCVPASAVCPPPPPPPPVLVVPLAALGPPKPPPSETVPDNSGSFTVNFKEGVLVVFKSDMLHCVEKHNLDSDRITIANNYKLGN